MIKEIILYGAYGIHELNRTQNKHIYVQSSNNQYNETAAFVVHISKKLRKIFKKN